MQKQRQPLGIYGVIFFLNANFGEGVQLILFAVVKASLESTSQLKRATNLHQYYPATLIWKLLHRHTP